MEQKNNGQDTPIERRPHAQQPASLEGAQPPASLLPDILARLGLSSPPSGISVDGYLAALGSTKWQERADAVQALGEIGTPTVLQPLIESLKDEQEAVRMAAVRALGKLARHMQVPMEHFIYAWNDPDGEVRATVVEVLGQRLPVDLLIAALKDNKKIVRIAAINVAGTLGDHAPVQELVEALQDPEWLVRETAAFALGKLRKRVPVEPLIHGLYDPSGFVREAAASALGERISTAINQLVYDLRYGDSPIREAAARALGELGERVPLGPLINAALNDPQSAVRKAAILALGQHGTRTPVTELQDALQDSDEDVRGAAMLVLEALYPDAAPAVPTHSHIRREAQPQGTQQLTRREPVTEGRAFSPAAEPHKTYTASDVGQRLGKYKLTDLLGSGRLATVYLGQGADLKGPAAIKVLSVHLSGEDRVRFLSEAQSIAHLEHPHIVRVLDFGVEDGIPFLVMDYAPGGSLRQRHRADKQVPLPTVVSYVKQIAAALQYAHDRGVIHRDVKPENMLLDNNDEVVLSDFGITVQAERDGYNRYQYKISGTFPYTAPECFDGMPGKASDQYALGIVVYEWLCGSRPFSGSFSAVLNQHLRMPPPPLHRKNPGIPDAVETVVMKALAKHPMDRYGSIHEFASALEQASLSARQ